MTVTDDGTIGHHSNLIHNVDPERQESHTISFYCSIGLELKNG